MKILHFPLVKLIFSFVVGILIYPYVNLDILYVIILVFALLALSILSHSFYRKDKFKLIFGVNILLLGFLLGFYTAFTHKETNNPNHYTKLNLSSEGKYNLTLKIIERLKTTQKNYRFVSEIYAVNGKKCSGKTILNFSKNEPVKKIEYGDIIKLEATYYENRSSFNPFQFDYGKYLERQEIYAQCYTKSSSFHKLGSENNIWNYLSNYREKIILKLEPYFKSSDNFSVYKALILGQQQDISADIVQDYQFAGAVHILSVSGLHVGFILLFVQFLLKPLPNTKRGRFIKLVAVLLSLSVFSILAGMSPSVIRSVVMFSFLAIGLYYKRETNIYHTLLVSIFLILLIKPSFIYDVGFQLSYLALFFIIWLQPIFKELWKPKNKILIYFWDILTVSFAAQIGTLPLSLYYFHQFPGLFFLTNVLILFLVGVIMIFGVVTMLMAIVGFIPQIVVKILELLIQILNSIIHWVASFDSFVFRNISFNQLMMLSFYGLIITFIIYTKNKTYRNLLAAIASVVLIQSAFIYNKIVSESSSEGIVFNVRKNNLITERKGQNVTVYANDSIIKNLDANLGVQSYLMGNFSKITNAYPMQNLMYINSKKILVIDSVAVFSKNIQPDILLITNSPKLNLDRVLQTMTPKIVVVDGSNFKSYSQLWEATCRKRKIPFHNTHEKGFYMF